MTTTTKPSQGAYRAALAMTGDSEHKVYVYGGLQEFCGHRHGWASAGDIAELIDRETDCGVMLDALEMLVKQGAFPTEAYEKALAVIRKVRGGE